MHDVSIEVTDLVAHVMAHGNVTGIQRVQERILHELATAGQGHAVWCLALDQRRGGYLACRLEDLYAGPACDLVERLAGLAGENTTSRWPTRGEVRRHLNRRGVRGWKRAVSKAGIAARAVLSPGSLQRQGIRRPRPSPPAAVHLAALPATSTLVLLGAGWINRDVSAAAARHAQAGGRVVQCHYDLIPIKHPEYFEDKLQRAFREHFDRTVHHASKVVCISEHTRRDFESAMGAHGLQLHVAVVPLAHEFPGYPRNARGCTPDDDRLLALGEPGRPFMLCVGTLEVRKNGLALLQAWQQLRASLGEAAPHLVFCGRRGWKMKAFDAVLEADPWLRDRVHLITDASDADVAFLHERSLCSIYPSLYEGWGLPVGEAAWFGRLCITSRESSLPEVCGMLADYVDPRNPADIAERVQRVVEDRSWLAMREDLIRQAPLRTWRDVAASFLATISDEPAVVPSLDEASPCLPLRHAA